MAVHQEKMEFSIPSDFKYLGAVDAAIQDLARELSCGQRWINDFSTALVEACSNAIEHGNKYDKGKTVRVAISVNGRKLIACVEDEGDGFDYDGYLSDSTPPDPLSERGRGILIMSAFTDKLRYSRSSGGGVCVELEKACEKDPGSPKP
ncbi:MAG: ATP-binding protein [Candidatus Krumholzibacteriia bacterium]